MKTTLAGAIAIARLTGCAWPAVARLALRCCGRAHWSDARRAGRRRAACATPRRLRRPICNWPAPVRRRPPLGVDSSKVLPVSSSQVDAQSYQVDLDAGGAAQTASSTPPEM